MIVWYCTCMVWAPLPALTFAAAIIPCVVDMVGWSLSCLLRGLRFDFSNEHLGSCNKPHGQTLPPYGTTTGSERISRVPGNRGQDTCWTKPSPKRKKNLYWVIAVVVIIPNKDQTTYKHVHSIQTRKPIKTN